MHILSDLNWLIGRNFSISPILIVKYSGISANLVGVLDDFQPNDEDEECEMALLDISFEF